MLQNFLKEIKCEQLLQVVVVLLEVGGVLVIAV